MRNRESEFLRSAGPTDASSYPKETDSMNMKPAAKPSCMKDLPTIPTKPIKKIFNFMVQFDESAIPKAAKPFRVYFGQGDEYLHDSLSKMVRYLAVIYCQWSSSFGQGPNCRKKEQDFPWNWQWTWSVLLSRTAHTPKFCQKDGSRCPLFVKQLTSLRR